jgi:hypothetical protein
MSLETARKRPLWFRERFAFSQDLTIQCARWGTGWPPRVDLWALCCALYAAAPRQDHCVPSLSMRCAVAWVLQRDSVGCYRVQHDTFARAHMAAPWNGDFDVIPCGRSGSNGRPVRRCRRYARGMIGMLMSTPSQLYGAVLSLALATALAIKDVYQTPPAIARRAADILKQNGR